MYWFRQHLFTGEAPKTLSFWFSQEEISCKRQNIREAILEIAKQQNPDKIGLVSKKIKTATKATDNKYNEWLKKMMKSQFHFYRGYSEIETLDKVSSEQISSRKSSIFDNDDNTSIHVQQAAEGVPEPLVQPVQHANPAQPTDSSSSDVEQTGHEQPIAEEEKGPKIPTATDWEAGQPRRSKRVRKNKFIFNLWQ